MSRAHHGPYTFINPIWSAITYAFMGPRARPRTAKRVRFNRPIFFAKVSTSPDAFAVVPPISNAIYSASFAVRSTKDRHHQPGRFERFPTKKIDRKRNRPSDRRGQNTLNRRVQRYRRLCTLSKSRYANACGPGTDF